ncbi:hypothetical protein E1258_19970 [Micromonospora sp. KC207]|uniref:streptophobe family protein n=1 Tax=Micromonospora sp. KC207 TaxID=2530377 RepID=UPI0010430ADA|nr:streptophobe family protein [Micromonospora sp. KC207]TDC58890.1 hypothetical protein E1258_19970 [Micromonospora sp. KC207]
MAAVEDTGARQAARGGRVRTVGIPFARGIAAGAAAVLAMAALSAVALACAGAARLGDLPPMVATVVALAAGGRADVALASTGRGGALGGLVGSLEVMPLGITLAGVVVLAVLLLHGHRGASPPGLAARAAGAVTGYLALLVTVAGLGHGSLGHPATTGAPAPVLRPGAGGGPGGGLGGNRSLGNLIADGRVLEYRTDVGSTALHGCLLVLAVLLLCWLISRVAPGPVRDMVRPAMSAVATVLLTAGTLVVIAGLLAAAGRGLGAKGLAAALLAGPNAVVIGWSSGLGVPWTIDATGVFGDRLPTGTGTVLPGGAGSWPKPLLDPATMGDTAGLATIVLAVLLTLACGVLTAVRTERSARSDTPTVPRVVQPALSLGVVLALSLGILVLAAGATSGMELRVLAFTLPAVTFEVDGGLWRALLGGLLGGAAAGLAGTGLVAAARRLRRAG